MDTNAETPRVPENEPRPATKRTSSKRWALLVLGIVLIALTIGFLRNRAVAGPASPAAAAGSDRPVPVAVVSAARRDLPIVLEGLGTVTPIAAVTVKTQVDGRLEKVFFKEGQTVHRGEVLAQVDARPYAIQLELARAAQQRDEVQLRNAKLNLERYTGLRQQNLISQQQVDDQRTLVDQTAATIGTDKAQIHSAQLMLDYARIVSPIDGVTGVRMVDPGNIVRASDQGGIVLVTQMDPIAVMFSLPEDELPRMLGQMSAGPVSLEAMARDGATKLGTGQLSLIDNQINQATATIRLKGVFPNPEKALWPNEFVRVRVLLTTLPGALVIPAAAVQRGPKGTFVYVVGPDKTATTRPVDLETTQGDLVVISRGLQPGEQVVTEGQNQLRPGARVVNRSPATAASGSAAEPSRPRNAP